jgi:DNA-binding transcriptional MerR regulator
VRTYEQDENKTWQVGDVTRETGLTVRALHHYDRLELLPPSSRT